eukprot:15430287-Alexandrium_andersonii.AAC.1
MQCCVVLFWEICGAVVPRSAVRRSAILLRMRGTVLFPVVQSSETQQLSAQCHSGPGPCLHVLHGCAIRFCEEGT